MIGLPDNYRGAVAVRCLVAVVAIQRWKAQPELRERYRDVAELADRPAEQFHHDHGGGDYIAVERLPEVTQ
ncbi:MAG: hypothetical protein M5U09_21185 [Gammaproteobacteria bacterium]|nr:hypothetical protein [Gammaproteobacteria bacterium]